MLPKSCTTASTTRFLRKLDEDLLHLREHLQELQALISQHLATHPCVDCGIANPALLDFDHVRGSKLFAISDALYERVTRSELRQEIEKCEIRCRNCHTLRHFPIRHVYLSPEKIDYYLNKERDKRLKKPKRSVRYYGGKLHIARS